MLRIKATFLSSPLPKNLSVTRASSHYSLSSRRPRRTDLSRALIYISAFQCALFKFRIVIMGFIAHDDDFNCVLKFIIISSCIVFH